MWRRRVLMTFVVLVSLVACGVHSWSQEPAAPAVAGFESRGSVTAGYRFTDIAGYKPNFAQFFGLRSGFRVLDLDVSGRSNTGTRRFADSYSLTADGIGGEPFAGGAFRMSKTNVYDFRVTYRQSYFYWNSNDASLDPTGLPGLTANHDWATVRKWGGVQLNVRPTQNLQVSVEYNRNTRKGTNFTTRVVDYFNASSVWGAFERANPYYVAAPFDETSNRFGLGFSYTWRDWNLFYRTGYQSYEENVLVTNAVTPERSINTGDASTAGERINQASWTEFRRLRSPVSEFSYNGRPARRLQLRGGYIYYRYTGPATVSASFSGTARTNTAGTTTAPYSATETDSMHVREPNHVIDQGFSYEVKDWWNIHLDYRYSRTTIDSSGSFNSTSSATGPSQGTTEHEWRYGLHIVDLALEFLPAPKVILRPGIRLMKRDVTVVDDGAVNPIASARSKLVSPIVSVAYTPSERLSLRADFQTQANGTPYTRITPRTDITSRFVGRYQATEKLSVENAFNIRNGKYASTDFRNSYRSNGTALTYQFNDRYAAFGGFTYDSFLATASVTFLRGTAPLNTVWRDQTINRVWQGGVEAKPSKNLEVRLSGNYLRTTGVGEISGETPVYGPIRWPLATGTIAYRFPRVGRLSVDLQRTYFIQDGFTGDNFSGNVLGIRWTKEF